MYVYRTVYCAMNEHTCYIVNKEFKSDVNDVSASPATSPTVRQRQNLNHQIGQEGWSKTEAAI